MSAMAGTGAENRMHCAEPGCAGTIVEGYCDTCGVAPPIGTVAAPVAGAADGTQCRETGCTGTISDDYCDLCGIAAASVVAASCPAPTVSVRTVRSGTRSVRTRSSSSRARRGSLGAGMVEVPRVARVDPASAVLPDPSVPESKRFCSNC